MRGPLARWALGLWVGVGALFVYKYGIRVTPWAGVLTLGYAALAGYALWAEQQGRAGRRWVLPAFGLWSLLLAVVCGLTDPDRLNVDRHSMVYAFWDAVLAGQHPLVARTHLGYTATAFPALYVTLVPFYPLGWYALPTWLAVAAMGYWAYRHRATVRYSHVLALCLLSPAVAYEVVVRSSVLWNGAMCLALVLWLLPKLETPLRTPMNLLALGLVVGLGLFTRTLVAIPLAVVVGHLLRRWPLTRVLRWGVWVGLGAALVGMVQLLPLYLWDPELFLAQGPFARQARFLPPATLAALVVGAVAVGYGVALPTAPSRPRLVLWGGLYCLLVVVVYAGYVVARVGWAETYPANGLDISYFTFGLPLVAWGLACRESFAPS